MFLVYNDFRDRADKLRQRLADLCQAALRNPAEVTLLPVTKTQPPEAAIYVHRYGLKSVGENRVQEAVAKRETAGLPVLRWELIGHLQTNKANLAAQHFDRVQSVDSEKLLRALDAAAGAIARSLPVLLQVNAGHDPAKFGVDPSDAPRLLELALTLPHLRVDGLMTIAPLSDDAAVARRTFARLRTVRDDLATQFGVPLRELSMGMSGDLDAAVTEGSTLVRVGTALFGPRG